MGLKHSPLLKPALGFLFIGFIPLILGVARCSNSIRAEDESKPARTGGGPCEYNKYEGLCRITSVRPTGSDQNDAALPYDGYAVGFSFQTEHDIQPYYASLLEKEHQLKLTNSWPVGRRFLRKYGIREGSVFECTLHVIVHGTCTPIRFDFRSIDLSDYFEVQTK